MLLVITFPKPLTRLAIIFILASFITYIATKNIAILKAGGEGGYRAILLVEAREVVKLDLKREGSSSRCSLLLEFSLRNL